MSQQRAVAYRAFYLQIGISVLIAIFFLCWRGWDYAAASLLGSVCWLLPNFYFIRKLFIMRNGQVTAQQMLKNLYIGEVVKFVVSAILVAASLYFLPLAGLPFFIGFIAAVLSVWVLPIFIK